MLRLYKLNKKVTKFNRQGSLTLTEIPATTANVETDTTYLNAFIDSFIVMGPDHGGSDLLRRPRFSWDIKSVPWTDGKGEQQEYASAVALWNAFHDRLPATNSNKIPPELRGIMLQSNLYGRAKDLCKKISAEVIQSAGGTDAIVKALYKRDPLSTVSTVYQDFIALLETKRGGNDSFKNFESRFEARVSKFNAHADACKLPEAMTAFMLLANSSVDSSQIISVLAAASPHESTFEGDPTTADYLNAVSYDSVSAVLRQCDNLKVSEGNVHSTSLGANSASASASSSYRTHRNKRILTPEQLSDLKRKSTCHLCKMKGHWKSDHNSDGSLKPGAKSIPADDSSKTTLKKTVTFNMVNLPKDSISVPCDFVGPLLDDGAPYSGMGLSELKILQPFLLPDWDGKLEPLPSAVSDRPLWQYGSGQHASAMRKIIGSIVLQAKIKHGEYVQIRHLVIEGSSQWVIGRNVTKLCDIIHIGGNHLKLPKGLTIDLVNHDMHSYVPYDLFCDTKTIRGRAWKTKMFCATAHIPAVEDRRPWDELKKIVDKVHKHVCGLSSYSDIKVLLQRNKLWDSEVMKYLARIIESCTKCSHTSEPKTSRKVSLSSLNRTFNKVICIDHFHLESMRVLHLMDTATRYSVGAVVPDTSTKSAIEVIDSHWISPFWAPEAIQYDRAFENEIFKSYLSKYDIEGRPIPARRHNKNVLESKHRIIRDIFLRLTSDVSDESEKNDPLIVQQAIRISNDLYGNDVLSAHELAKGFTRPVENAGMPTLLPDEIIKAHEALIAKRKLTLILRSQATKDCPISVGDMVQVYIKLQNEKRGKWSNPRPVLSFDLKSCTVTVPGASGRTICAAIEDVRPAIIEESFACKVQEAIDEMDLALDDTISTLETETSSKDNKNVDAVVHYEDTGDDICSTIRDDGDFMVPNPTVGESVEVYWPLDDQYYPGVVSCINNEGFFIVDYNDGDQETLNMAEEIWLPMSESISSHEVQLTGIQELKSNASQTLKLYFDMFGHKEFMIHQAERLPSYAIRNAYTMEEQKFKETVREVNVIDVPTNANVITSHVIYKVKENDDGTLKMKARIAPHGNKDRDRESLKSDAATCPPTGIRLLLSTATIMKWPLAKIDFTSAFLQTGEAQRDVYVVPPRECSDRSKYWLLLTAAYGLVNAGAKWQEQCDEFLRSLGLKQLKFVPQLFYHTHNNELSIVAVKIVDDILFAGPKACVQKVIEKISATYKLGTVVYGPGAFLFFGLQIIQDTDYSVTVHGDDKLSSLECFPIDRHRRKHIDANLTDIELKSFRSINSSIGWLGIAASPFCALYASYLQQKAPTPNVGDLITQINSLRVLKKLGSAVKFVRPPNGREIKLSVLVFADASRTESNGQLCYIAGLLFGDLVNKTTFHTISWASHKSKRPVKSIGAAEILAAGEAIDEGKMLAKSYEELLAVKVDLWIAVDSKDLFSTLSTCRNSTDRSIRGDVTVIRYEFETKNVSRMIWIPGKINLADPGTKPNSPLAPLLNLLLFNGHLPLDFKEALTRDSDQFTG